MLTLVCPSCRKTLSLAESFAGKKVRCPGCRETTIVPAPEQATMPPANSEQATLPPHDDPDATIPPGTARPVSTDSRAPAGYEIIVELGRGGMGVVYKARHLKLNRDVALKMILSGAHAGGDEVGRFRTEAEAIARLQHPGIVQVFEIGEHDGRAFFSLEFCAGGSLEKKLNGTPLKPEEAAELVRKLARSMHAAHEARLIHRDLKPANVLLTADDKPKITDFGLAKKLDEQGQTQTGSVMGTPSYMAPEQAEGRKDIGPSCDIYALGAILYECLTGRPPFRAATSFDTIMQVISDDPVPVTQLNARVPADLETICLKCLRKEPKKRYRTALELADDLQRWLDGEPIAARPVGAMERGLKWMKRKPTLAALVSVSVLGALLLVVGGLFFTWHLMRALSRAETAEEDAKAQAALEKKARDDATKLADKEAEARQKAEAETLRAEHARHASQLDLAIRAWEQHDVQRAELHLDQVKKHEFANLWETKYVKGLIARKVTRINHRNAFSAIAYRPDGKHFATASEGFTCTVWDAATLKPLFELRGHKSQVNDIVYSRDGKLIATAGNYDKTIRLWDADTGKSKVELTGHQWSVNKIAFNKDGTRLASASNDGTVRIWDIAEGKTLYTTKKETTWIQCVAYNRAGTMIAAGTKTGKIFLYKGEDGTLVRTIEPLSKKSGWDHHGISAVAFGTTFDAKGEDILAAGDGNDIALYKTDGTLLRIFKGHNWPVTSLLFTEGYLLLSGSQDQSCRLWNHADRAGNELIATLYGYRNQVAGVAISPGGRRIISANKGHMLDVWNLRVTQEHAILTGFTSYLTGVAFSPDGKMLAASCDDKTVSLFDMATMKRTAQFKEHKSQANSVAFSGDSKFLVSGDSASTVHVFDVTQKKLHHTLKGHSSIVRNAVISRDGSILASCSHDQTARIWDAKTGKMKFSLPHQGKDIWLYALALSDDGKLLATGGTNGKAMLWDTSTGTLVRTIEVGQHTFVNALAFSHDGKWIASAARELVEVWEVATGKRHREMKGHTGTVYAVAWNKDGTRIVSGSDDRTLKVWDVQTGEEKLSLRGHTSMIRTVAVSEDDRFIVSAGMDRTVRVWKMGK